MADAIISAILGELVTILKEEIKNEVKLLTGFHDEVKKLRTNLETLRTVLLDAEEKQVTSQSIKLWLSRLKDLSYDMDDVLDEWRTVLLRSKLNRENNEPKPSSVTAVVKRKVRGMFSSSSRRKVSIRRDLAVKMQEINGRLDEVVKDTVFTQLTPREPMMIRKQPETTAFVDVAKIRGRDEIKETIVDSLFAAAGNSATHHHDLQTISIVGMGGMGKTALAQVIYNHDRVVQGFEKRLWVCVSDLFDESRIAKAIIVALEGLERNSNYLLENVPMQALMERICTSITGKRFFLVLDDIWTEKEEDFESLKRTFKYGESGSKIVVTTRKDGVAKMMESSPIFHLRELSEEDCWQVVSQAASFEKRDHHHRLMLEGIGRKIAGKCKGLPLAAKTLGSLLRDKDTRDEWLNVLNSEVWKQAKAAGKEFFAPFLISYYDLPLKIRHCFVYCAVYPKDYVMWTSHLIHHWMAQGYLSLEGNPEMEVVGMQYFKYLADRSFFQDFNYDDYDGSVMNCKMHDIVHDFALFLAENEFVTKDVITSSTVSTTLDLSDCSKMRHLTVMIAKGCEFPHSISGAEKLRTVVTFTDEDAITIPALQNLAKGSKRLRTLDLEFPDGNHLVGGMLSEVGSLMHLVHLNLACNKKVIELPDTICDLINLMYFDLKGCSGIDRLPDGIGKLINLRYFRTVGCSITYYPKGVGKLTVLRVLYPAIVRADCNHPEKFSLSDLENMNNLRLLYMELTGWKLDINEARRAKMDQKIHLTDLRILSPGIGEDGVIDALNPPPTSNPFIFTNRWRWWSR